MTTLFWKPLPVLTLTVRQFLGGKAVRVVTLLSFVPALFGLIYLINPDVADARDFLIDTIVTGVVLPTLLPITVLILATGALGNEVEDRTLPYLTLKPLSRLRIVIEKLGGVLVVTIPTILAGLAVTYLLVVRDDAGDDLDLLWAMLAAAVAGVVANAALFLLVSLVIPRALLAGIVYSFLWESLLSRYLPGVRSVSIRHYVHSIFVRTLDDPFVTLEGAARLQSAVITLAVLTVAAVLLTTWRLRRMNLD